VVNLAHHHGLDAETALTGATARFEQRYRLIERTAGKPLRELSLDEYEDLWRQAKAALATKD
jgi:uncharacterized protein YabN with tetrapyrrole methylase and pyrophosphatase domain